MIYKKTLDAHQLPHFQKRESDQWQNGGTPRRPKASWAFSEFLFIIGMNLLSIRRVKLCNNDINKNIFVGYRLLPCAGSYDLL